jgi:hypothetical protein
MLGDHHPVFNEEDYLSWFRTNGPDFVAKFGEDKLLHYAGWPIVGQVTNLNDLDTILQSPLIEVQEVVVL